VTWATNVRAARSATPDRACFTTSFALGARYFEVTMRRQGIVGVTAEIAWGDRRSVTHRSTRQSDAPSIRGPMGWCTAGPHSVWSASLSRATAGPSARLGALRRPRG
jgi:hypothetical protein